MKLTLTERATTDIDRIRRHVREQSPTGATNVIMAIEAAMAVIEAHPLAVPLVLPTVRMKVVQPYGYKIFYEIRDEIEVVHIRHPSRSPDWR